MKHICLQPAVTTRATTSPATTVFHRIVFHPVEVRQTGKPPKATVFPPPLYLPPRLGGDREGGLSRNPAPRRNRKSNGYIGSPSRSVQEKLNGFAGRNAKVSTELKAEFSENDGSPSGLGEMRRMGEITGSTL